LAGRGHLSVQKIKDVYVLEKKKSAVGLVV
jgi:hypothetical protein